MRTVFRFMQIIGLVLLIICLVLALATVFKTKQAQNGTPIIVENINNLLPDSYSISIDEYAGHDMPAIELEGTDYIGLIEVPGFSIQLPVQGDWENKDLAKGPCRFWGSIYNSDLIIGGKNQQAQFEFCQQVDIGEKINIIDMRGALFNLTVQKIERSSDVSFEKLSEGEYPLSLFVKEKYDDKYIIVRCGQSY